MGFCQAHLGNRDGETIQLQEEFFHQKEFHVAQTEGFYYFQETCCQKMTL